MSQFPLKYKEPSYKRRVFRHVEDEDFDGQVWEFWRKWGLYEYLVLGLLAAILVILLQLLTKEQHHSNKQRVQEFSSVKKEIKTPDFDLSNPSYPAHVLPENPLPPKTMVKGKEVYGPVSLQDYLYFADETGAAYPDYVDAKTKQLIKAKAGECHSFDCPLHGIPKEQLETYLKWVNLYSSKSLRLWKAEGKIYLLPAERSLS